MRTLTVATLAILLIGCSTAMQTYQFEKSRTYSASPDQVWEGVMQYFTANNIQIKTLERESGVVYAEMVYPNQLGACAIGCFCWAPRGFAGNETSDCLLQSATRGHRPAGGRGMPVDGPAGRADWGRIALLHAAASPCIRFMFNARHTRAHSPRAWSRPRTLKRRKPSACLIQPLGASDSHLRLAYCA